MPSFRLISCLFMLIVTPAPAQAPPYRSDDPEILRGELRSNYRLTLEPEKRMVRVLTVERQQ